MHVASCPYTMSSAETHGLRLCPHAYPYPARMIALHRINNALEQQHVWSLMQLYHGVLSQEQFRRPQQSSRAAKSPCLPAYLRAKIQGCSSKPALDTYLLTCL